MSYKSVSYKLSILGLIALTALNGGLLVASEGDMPQEQSALRKAGQVAYALTSGITTVLSDPASVVIPGVEWGYAFLKDGSQRMIRSAGSNLSQGLLEGAQQKVPGVVNLLAGDQGQAPLAGEGQLPDLADPEHPVQDNPVPAQEQPASASLLKVKFEGRAVALDINEAAVEKLGDRLTQAVFASAEKKVRAMMNKMQGPQMPQAPGLADDDLPAEEAPLGEDHVLRGEPQIDPEEPQADDAAVPPAQEPLAGAEELNLEAHLSEAEFLEAEAEFLEALQGGGEPPLVPAARLEPELTGAAKVLDNVLGALNNQVVKKRGVRITPNGKLLLKNIARALKDAGMGAVRESIKNGEARAMIKEGSALLKEQLQDPESLKGVADEIKRLVNDQAGVVSETIRGKFIRTLPYAVGAGIVLALGSYGSWVLWKQIDRSLSKPKLILKTSERSFWQKIKGVFVKKEPFKAEMILSPEMKQRLDSIALTTKKITAKIKEGQKNFKYRNVLLHGKPGVGKSMFAEILADKSDMIYQEMSGASIFQFRNGEGITEMNNFFEYIRNAPGPVLVFMDEAESFLGGRVGVDSHDGGTVDVTQDAYQLVNNFLYHTGTLSNKVMFVFATNHPELLDNAMGRRIGIEVELELPGPDERAKILHLYRDKILLDPWQNTPAFIEAAKVSMSDAVIEQIARKTDGFSGSELEGIINSVIADSSITEDGLVTPALIDLALKQEIAKRLAFENRFKKQRQPRAAAQAG